MSSRILALLLALGTTLALPSMSGAQRTLWLSPLSATTGDSRLTIEHGSPVTSIRVTTNAPGDPQWILLGLPLPSDVRIEEVTVCYELENANSFISQVRLTRMTLPTLATVIHDDGTDLTDIGPTCYASDVGSDPVEGTITLHLRLNFASANHWIDIGAIGVLLSDAVSDVGTDFPDASPERVSLGQNRPNPFNPRTTITYLLDTARLVDLSIYDVSGRVVRTLIREPQTAGSHSVEWDGRNDAGAEMPSGTYYYTIRSGDRDDSRGMVLLR